MGGLLWRQSSESGRPRPAPPGRCGRSRCSGRDGRRASPAVPASVGFGTARADSRRATSGCRRCRSRIAARGGAGRLPAGPTAGRRWRQTFDGADRRGLRPAPPASGRRGPARRRSAIVQAPQTPCSQPTWVPVAPSPWRRKSVSSMRGWHAPVVRLAVEREAAPGGGCAAFRLRHRPRPPRCTWRRAGGPDRGDSGRWRAGRRSPPSSQAKSLSASSSASPSRSGQTSRAVGRSADAADGEPHAAGVDHRGAGDDGEIAVAAAELREGVAGAGSAQSGSATASIISSSRARRSSIMPMKKLSAAHRSRRCGAERSTTSPPSATQAQRDLGARVGMGDRAADRAAVAGLEVPDPGQGGGQQRHWSLRERRAPHQRRPARTRGADAEHAALARRSSRRSAMRMMSTSDARAGRGAC